jgi:hypothetical protein
LCTVIYNNSYFFAQKELAALRESISGLQRQAEKLQKKIDKKKRARNQNRDAPKRRKNYGSTQNCVSPFDADDDEEEEEDEVTGDEHDDEDVRYVKNSLLPIT